MTEPVDRTAVRLITHTGSPTRHPWPDDMFVQGGGRGIVFVGGGTAYKTAFVEAFPNNPPTFLRGEGDSIEAAEDACWARYQRMQACPAAPAHGPFEAQGYTNGVGTCTSCGTRFTSVLPPQPATEPRNETSLMGRLFSGDPDALDEVIDTMAHLDDLPSKPDGVGR